MLTRVCGALVVVAGAAASVLADGSIFLVGHDPDFHANQGANDVGAQRINQVAIGFVQDPLFNPFVAGAPKFLLVESMQPPPPGNIDGELGIAASGYVAGTDYDRHDALTLNAALDQLGQAGGYSAIVVGSDHGGMLTQAELNILNARVADIAAFVDAGGGLYAMAEGNNGPGTTPDGGWFGFVPGLLSSTAFNEPEGGNTVTPFGASLGLSDNDVNGNFSHNIFPFIGGLTAVGLNANGDVLSAAGRIGIPAPGAAAVLALGGAVAARRRRR